MVTMQADLEAYFSAIPRSRIVVELGMHSAWVSARRCFTPLGIVVWRQGTTWCYCVRGLIKSADCPKYLHEKPGHGSTRIQFRVLDLEVEGGAESLVLVNRDVAEACQRFQMPLQRG